jgi:hypothetical protein
MVLAKSCKPTAVCLPSSLSLEKEREAERNHPASRSWLLEVTQKTGEIIDVQHNQA